MKLNLRKREKEVKHTHKSPQQENPPCLSSSLKQAISVHLEILCQARSLTDRFLAHLSASV